MLNNGDKIRILHNLPPSADKHPRHVVHERKGTTAVVKEQDVLSVNRWWVTPDDKSISNFWVMTEWVEFYYEDAVETERCVCFIGDLMNRGCKCGQMDREKKNVQKG